MPEPKLLGSRLLLLGLVIGPAGMLRFRYTNS